MNLFKPKYSCSWMENLLYINLLGHDEDVTTAVPDKMEVKPVTAMGCFCSNDTHTLKKITL